jgi:dihydrofolate reductase
MAKIFLFMMVTLDGYFEGKDHDISWHNTDEDFNDFAIAQTGTVGTLLFGRRTYELMASYWPSEEAKTSDPIVAKQMNDMPKIVFSTTLENVGWQNTRLVKENLKEEIEELKKSSEKDIAVFGSSDLCISLLKEGLLDELRLMINPVVIGEGKILFEGLENKLELKQTNKRDFKNGNVLLTYNVVK